MTAEEPAEPAVQGAGSDEINHSLRTLPPIETIQGVGDVALTDPPLANLTILGGYQELSVILGRFLHGDRPPENATFATFAAWSVQTLRADVAPNAPDVDKLPRRPARRLYDRVVGATLADPQVLSRNIASGQAKIFEETFTAMHALLEVTMPAVKKGVTLDSHQWDRVTQRLIVRRDELNAMRPPGPTERLEEPDVLLLQDALQPYFKVLSRGLSGPYAGARAHKERAELILLGNLRFVAFEQRRIQPVLERNFSYLPQALRLKLVTRWLGRPNLVSNAATRAYPYVAPHLGLIDEAFQIAVTRYIYSLTIGAEDLRFGTDLPLPPPAHPLLRNDQPTIDNAHYGEEEFFPYHLQAIDSPELWAEWSKHDRSSGQGIHTSVDNWLRYPERMNFIANLFRSRQQLSALYHRPSSTPPSLGAVHEGFDVRTRNRLNQFFADARTSSAD